MLAAPVDLSETSSTPTRGSSAPPTRRALRPRRGAFLLGAVVGLTAIPLTAVALAALARYGVGDRDVPFERLFTWAALLGGLPAALTAGGVARVAARAGFAGARPRIAAARTGAIAFSPAGVGLVLITALAASHLPEQLARWLYLAAAGLLVGAIAGALVGAAVGRPERVEQPPR